MNQLMPQRKETSSQAWYLPPSDSAMTWPNQRSIVYSRSSKPAATPTQPPEEAFITNAPPSIIRNSDIEPSTGQTMGCGTKQCGRGVVAPCAMSSLPIADASAGHDSHDRDQREDEKGHQHQRGGDQLQRPDAHAVVVRLAPDADQPRQHGLQ